MATVIAATITLAMVSGPVPTICPGCTPVFYPGLNGSACFRIPSIIRTSQGTLLAFSENRVTDCGDNGKNHALVSRRSTDEGVTWGPMQTVMEDVAPPCPTCPSAISNPNPVEITFPNKSKAILLAYDTMNNPTPTHHGMDMQMWSLDDGVSWGAGTVVSYPPQNNTGALIGPSVGLQAASGTIYFSAVFGNNHWMYWSTDFGSTWKASAAVEGLSECSIAFLVSADDGRIIMNCRTNAKLGRAQLIWGADGKPLGNVTYPKGLVDPGCQGSIVNQEGTLYTSNAVGPGRTHVTVKKSVDQGGSWSEGVLAWKGPSAYSQLVPMQEKGKVGLLFEAGVKGAYDSISFKVMAGM